jgi:hypothetical protein
MGHGKRYIVTKTAWRAAARGSSYLEIKMAECKLALRQKLK